MYIFNIIQDTAKVKHVNKKKYIKWEQAVKSQNKFV